MKNTKNVSAATSKKSSISQFHVGLQQITFLQAFRDCGGEIIILKEIIASLPYSTPITK
jgi:hypothetical protein